MNTSSKKSAVKFSVIGCGKVGAALAFLLRKKGFDPLFLFGRNRERLLSAKKFIGGGKITDDLVLAARNADILLITTPDDVVEQVCKKLAAKKSVKSGALVLHTSGALSADILNPLKKLGARTASMHPLMSFADWKKSATAFRNAFVACEGTAKKTAAALAKKLGAKPFFIDGAKKSLYHAGASAGSNFLISALHLGVLLMERAGMKRSQAQEALIPLVESVLDNFKTLGVPQALTGPIARGDVKTVAAQLSAVKKYAPKLLESFAAFALSTVEAALAKKSITPAQATALKKVICAECHK